MDALERPTKLERFLREHRIKPAQLARGAGCARQHLVRIRSGLTRRPRPAMRRAIAEACERLLERHVATEELFD
jgi:transcriptional regulator with XRE-family HTH domain